MEKTSGLLKRFALTFDYSHQIMYLERLVPRRPMPASSTALGCGSTPTTVATV
jgi:hypothetical protein